MTGAAGAEPSLHLARATAAGVQTLTSRLKHTEQLGNGEVINEGNKTPKYPV